MTHRNLRDSSALTKGHFPVMYVRAPYSDDRRSTRGFPRVIRASPAHLGFSGILITHSSFQHGNFHLSFFLLQVTIVLHPSKTRHNRDTGAGVKQGPAQRFLFRSRPCVDLFLLSLVAHILRIFHTTEKDAGVIGMRPRQDFARTWTHGVSY